MNSVPVMDTFQAVVVSNVSFPAPFSVSVNI